MAVSNRYDRNRQRQLNRGNYQTYVDGNTVRKVYEAPDHHEEHIRRHNKKVKERQKKEQVVHTHGSFGLAFCTMVLMVCLLTGCVFYLRIQAQVTESVKHINAMESELNKLRTANDSELARMDAAIDLEAIRQTAMNDLGMVYASEDQVVLYEGKSTDYVRQYADVPEAKEVGTLTKAAAAIEFK